jgi:hypothetical protein
MECDHRANLTDRLIAQGSCGSLSVLSRSDKAVYTAVRLYQRIISRAITYLRSYFKSFLAMLGQDELNFSWFYDSEERGHSPAKEFSIAEIARRPWKAFWPPQSEAHLDVWRCSEFPEVLSWRFDPEQPFDQPWRHWLQNLQIMDVEDDLQQELIREAEAPGGFVGIQLSLESLPISSEKSNLLSCYL